LHSPTPLKNLGLALLGLALGSLFFHLSLRNVSGDDLLDAISRLDGGAMILA
jgi:hypothetical protein